MIQSKIYIVLYLDIIILYYSYHTICYSYNKILFSEKLENNILNFGAEII